MSMGHNGPKSPRRIRFVPRGYDDEEEVQFQLNKVSGMKHSELLTPRPRKAQQITPFVITFHPDLPNLPGVLCECQCLINVSPRLKGALPQPPLIVYWWPPNLRSLLVRLSLKIHHQGIKETIGVANHDVKRVHILKQASCSTAPPPTRDFVWKPQLIAGPRMWCIWLNVPSVQSSTSERRKMHSEFV